ncbi:hypothetical protein CR513_43639, partial [Mucuna pruriens]
MAKGKTLKNMIAVVPLKALEPPYPKNYDPNAKCDYHAGVDLVDGGWLGFKENQSNVNNNPFSPHEGQSINALSHESSGQEFDEPGSSGERGGRYSEYQLLDQMNKIPARISLLSLLLNSKSHQNLLLKMLNEAHVAQDITVERFNDMVNNITGGGRLTFSKEEVLAEG